MALEAVVFPQKDPNFDYCCRDSSFNYNMGCYDDDFGLFKSLQEDQKPAASANLESSINGGEQIPSYNSWENYSSPSSLIAGNHTTAAASSLENTVAASIAGDSFSSGKSRRKRRRARTEKNRTDMENQRMTHIAVERNRRRQMNDYLAVLRSLMPPSYSQRGDQASIVGGAINFVKELEQLLQSLESCNKPAEETQEQSPTGRSNPLSGFFTFPQYTTSSITMDDHHHHPVITSMTERRYGVADIEVNMVDTHANIKILAKRQPKQLLKMVTRIQSLGFSILHLNITTVDQSVLYSLSVKVEEECLLSTVNEIAEAVHEIVEIIQQETATTLIREGCL